MKTLLTITTSAMLMLTIFVFASDDINPWPPAKEGYDRKVIRLEPLTEEQDHRVQIVAGEEMHIDCNRYHFNGSIEKRTDIGWGYPSYWLDKSFGPIIR